ncbi:hypothetical protein [Halalkalibacterium ligniniphilum]|uniref:hypothetical protein n=1 Tax=Halalkalibacterium ligniniphilum TaxID=1134413 RepID=UPI00034CAF51|nr:hypothetical protein [Halalkalibacterium ligniniphilum]
MPSFYELAESVMFAESDSTMAFVKKDDRLEFIGKGRSAIVFKIKSTSKVLKVFHPSFSDLAKEEAQIYETLQGVSYYPTLYESGPNYLVIDYIQGYTLSECLSKGIKIVKGYVDEIDRALKVAREKGLNPSDIHLKNILLTADDKIVLIDVARFRQDKNCTQWDDLKKAFYAYYSRPIFPKKIPAPLQNLIAVCYRKKLLPALF